MGNSNSDKVSIVTGALASLYTCLESYDEVLYKDVPWEHLQNTIPDLVTDPATYSEESVQLIGEIRTELAHGVQAKSTVLQPVRQMLEFTRSQLTTLKEQIDGRSLVKFFGDVNQKMRSAQNPLATLSLQFNRLSGKMVLLQAYLKRDSVQPKGDSRPSPAFYSNLKDAIDQANTEISGNKVNIEVRISSIEMEVSGIERNASLNIDPESRGILKQAIQTVIDKANECLRKQ